MSSEKSRFENWSQKSQSFRQCLFCYQDGSRKRLGRNQV